MATNMFAAHLRRVYYTCNRIIIRELRGSKFKPTGANPGLDKRISAFQKEGLKITEDDTEEYVEQSESDMYNVGVAYNEHINETLIGKHELRCQIVKEKYFKENMPNLLTWSEKEQIRHLHNEHPNEWTPEKIAESFPVTVAVVKKLLKYPWKPASQERIARHDASAMRNWKELKEGTLDIPKHLREHFLKYSARSIPPLDQKSIKIDLTKERELGEFERIVQRCAQKERSKSNENIPNSSDETSEPQKIKVKKDSKVVTLEQLTNKLKKRIESGKKVDLSDTLIINSGESKPTFTPSNIAKELELANKETKIVAYKEEDENTKSIMEYPERIRIPKKAYKKGATYKVNDCYYDHDGKFLYRVLGMSN